MRWPPKKNVFSCLLTLPMIYNNYLQCSLFISFNWSQFQGLVVVDVYSEWSGPCSAMTNFLKKIKLEVNDDLLHYAMAKTDTIPQLEIFRGQCKPTWLFISGGEPVAVMHGANAPLLQKMIEREIRKER